MNIVMQEELLSLCLSQSLKEESRSQLEDCMNKLMALQEVISIEDGTEPTLIDVLSRVIRFYEMFVPIESQAKWCRFEVGKQLHRSLTGLRARRTTGPDMRG